MSGREDTVDALFRQLENDQDRFFLTRGVREQRIHSPIVVRAFPELDAAAAVRDSFQRTAMKILDGAVLAGLMDLLDSPSNGREHSQAALAATQGVQERFAVKPS
jgi:hypothetical protein